MKSKPLIIFEIANNHMGDLNHLSKIIEEYYKIKKIFSKKINFAIKFQYRHLPTFIHPEFKESDHSGVKRFESTELTEIKWKKIISTTKKKFDLICTPFDELSIDKVLRDGFKFLKIASCSANDWPLLEYLEKKNKKKNIICSLGGMNLDEISETVSFFRNRKIHVQYLYCVANYPTQIRDLNLDFFKVLKDTYGDLIAGISSHETPEETMSGSIGYAMGARIFEKHIGINTENYTLNKYSCEPKHIIAWLKNLEHAVDICGDSKKRTANLKNEKKQLANFKRGIYLKRNLSKGETLSLNNISFKFPSQNGQLFANDFSKFKEFKLNKNLKKNQKILLKDVRVKNNKNILQKIRDQVRNLVFLSKVILPKSSNIEISHHYGINFFYKFGMCMITIYNNKYCKKLLFLIEKQEHPEQYHKKKKETFFILYGRVSIILKYYKKNILYKKKKIVLNQGDLQTIEPGVVHSFRSLGKTGAVIEELSSESNKKDSFYWDKEIEKNKNRKSFISTVF